MDKVSSLFFELLRIALGRQDAFLAAPAAEEWPQLYGLARKQALVGVCFAGVERLPAGQRPPRELLLQWFTVVMQIEARNAVMNARSVEACRYFERQGFRACVLKGQGNALMYPWPQRRQSGDVDIWLVPDVMDNGQWRMDNGEGRKENGGGGKENGQWEMDNGQWTRLREVDLKRSRRAVLRWARKRFPKEEFDWKHIHFPIFPGVEMEVHFVPSLLRSPVANRHLRRFYEQEAEAQMRHSVRLAGVEEELGELNCPTAEFNLVFQLTHIFDHFLSEGVGLRQVMDYYFLLLLQRNNGQRTVDRGKCGASLQVIKSVGLYGFAGALMWVLHEVLGIEEDLMLCPADERRGRVLLDEILAGGNFGQYESRYWYTGMSRWKFYVARMRRMMHFLRYYPSEVLWDIPFRIRQRVWMWRN